MRSCLWAFPSGSGYPLYLFCLHRAKKDAAAIPNAASRHPMFKQGNFSFNSFFDNVLYRKAIQKSFFLQRVRVASVSFSKLIMLRILHIL